MVWGFRVEGTLVGLKGSRGFRIEGFRALNPKPKPLTLNPKSLTLNPAGSGHVDLQGGGG